jgi:hypothetical protein
MANTLMVTPIVVRGGELTGGPSSPFTASFAGKGAQSSVFVHALVETEASEPELLCQRILATLQSSFIRQERASLTAALSRAIQASHRDLQEANEQQQLTNRVGAGLTCLALNGTDITVAQAGPGVVYLRDAHGVRTIEPPKISPTDEAGPGEGNLPLGIAAGEIPVLLDRHALEAQEVLLAANSALSSSVSYDGLVAILSCTPNEAADKLRMVTQDDPYFAALLVTRL